MLGDELKIQDQSFVHSVITWPRGEFDIEFAAVELAFTLLVVRIGRLFAREEPPAASINR
ncbi:hypothetical protein GCM10023346_13490 [Arthrobacter gyeryongensis]|uniref:Uncharacterized protein n=1 Tax=Arthrobacter gyeryongensis TaxID=1650592 RepID=A0ABP9S7H1_9MICC